MIKLIKEIGDILFFVEVLISIMQSLRNDACSYVEKQTEVINYYIILYVREVLTHFIKKVIIQIGQDFFDIMYTYIKN